MSRMPTDGLSDIERTEVIALLRKAISPEPDMTSDEAYRMAQLINRAGDELLDLFKMARSGDVPK